MATCNPATKVCLAVTADAVGTPVWECKGAADMVGVPISSASMEFGAVICGPGSFSFSPMQCAGDKFDYKVQKLEIAASEWSGGACPDWQEGVFPVHDGVLQGGLLR